MSAQLTDTDYRRAADALGVNVPSIKAVVAVESSGSGFLKDGRPKVLFERHVMFRRVATKFGDTRAEGFAAKHPDLISRKSGGYGTQDKEPDRMGRAADLIDRDCALESASWGLFQIMGYHWKLLGFSTLQAFINAMYRDEGAHLDAFVKFILADANLLRALRSKDWAAFARIYNGPAFASNKYDTKLAEAYRKAGGIA